MQQQQQQHLQVPLLHAAMEYSQKRARRRKLLQRLGAVVCLLTAATLLAFVAETDRRLPCPYCRIASFVGWAYFLCWSISFYPQLLINWRRKSVEGLSFDFAALNVLGFACYSQFNLALFFSPAVQAEYRARFGAAQGIPVELNDVVFGLHALVMSLVLAVQCLMYERADHQRVSLGTSLGLAGSVSAALGLAGYLAVSGEARPPLTWLDLCYFCSFVKMGVTLVKYIPQLHLNRLNQSTAGWSIDNVLLDLSGGVLSVGQLLISCWVLKDWTAVTGNPIKFALGALSICFDCLFALQHYVWYHPLRGGRLPTSTSAGAVAAGAAAAGGATTLQAGYKQLQHADDDEQHTLVVAVDAGSSAGSSSGSSSGSRRESPRAAHHH